MLGPNAHHVEAQDQHEHFGERRGGRPIAEHDVFAALDGADQMRQEGEVAQLDGFAGEE